MRKRFLASLAALLVCTLVLTACSSKKPSDTTNSPSQSAQSKQFVTLIPFETSTLDPAVNYDMSAQAVLPAVYETLVAYSPDGKISPELATTWEISPDGKVYTFHLRKGVKFHDGTDFNAQAMKSSVERFTKIGLGASYIYKDTVDKIDTPDDSTIVFTLKKPLGYFLMSIASPWAGGAVSPKAVKEHEVNGDLAQDWFKGNADGTGAYKVIDTVPKDYVMLQRNPDWWGWAEAKNPNAPEKIMIKTVTEAATERLMIEKGEADLAYGIKPGDQADLQKNADLVVKAVSTANGRYLAFNNKAKPTDDVRVRQALSYSFPYDDAVASYGPGAKRMIGQLPEGMIGYDPSLPVYKTDLDKAKQLLTEAGFGNGGLKLDYVWVTGEDDGRRIGELWQANLQKLGVQLNIKEVAINAFIDMLKSPTTMAPIMAHMWTPDYPDFTGIVSVLYDGRQQKPDGTNMSFFQDKKVDDLLDQITVTVEQTKRVEQMKQTQTALLQDAPSIWVAFNSVLVVSRKDVQGHVQHPLFEYLVDYSRIHK